MRLLYILSIVSASLAYTKPPKPLDELEIRTKFSLYATATDTKQFNQYDDIFTQDVFADYGGQTYNGLSAFKAFETAAIGNNVTQHAVTNTVVDFVDSKAPNSTAYVVMTYLGQGDLSGQVCQFYGKYEDQWVQVRGAWRIKRRVLSLFVSVSDIVT